MVLMEGAWTSGLRRGIYTQSIAIFSRNAVGSSSTTRPSATAVNPLCSMVRKRKRFPSHQVYLPISSPYTSHTLGPARWFAIATSEKLAFDIDDRNLLAARTVKH